MDCSKNRTGTGDNGEESLSGADKSPIPAYSSLHPPFVQMFFHATLRGTDSIDEQFMEDIREPEGRNNSTAPDHATEQRLA